MSNEKRFILANLGFYFLIFLWAISNCVTVSNERKVAISQLSLSIGDRVFVRYNIAPGKQVRIFYWPWTGISNGERFWSVKAQFANGTVDGESDSVSTNGYAYRQLGERKLFDFVSTPIGDDVMICDGKTWGGSSCRR
ncbi:MAG TPA: hypothetical protein VGB45_02560 [Abditibacterium sp.]|jgi:hypothetical protein